MKKTDERLNEKKRLKEEKRKRGVHLGTKRFGHFLYDEGITEKKSIQPWVAIKLFNVEVSECKRETQTDGKVKVLVKLNREKEARRHKQKKK